MGTKPKEGRSPSTNKYKFCIICHVRTGAIAIGLWHLLFQLMALIFVTVILFNRDGFEQSIQEQLSGDVAVINLTSADGTFSLRGITFNAIPSATDEVDDLESQPVALPSTDNDNSWTNEDLKRNGHSTYIDLKGYRREDLHAAVAVTLCTMLVTILLLYGICRTRPGYVIPFFCVQLFDLTLTVLTLVGYVSYIPSLRAHLRANISNEAAGQYLDRMNDSCLLIGGLVISTFIIMFKIYLIKIIWSCHRYLCERVAQRAHARVYLDVEGGDGLNMTKEGLILPPAYEAVVKDAVPPPYTQVSGGSTA